MARRTRELAEVPVTVLEPVAQAGSALSSWLLVLSMAAIGVKTQIKELASVGLRPIVLMVGETVLLAVIVLVLVRLYG